MTYTAITVDTYRTTGGTPADKITGELKKIETELAAHATLEAAGVTVAKVALAGGAANAIAAAWANPTGGSILIHRAVVDVTTAGGTATAVLDVGVAANATTGADTLIDGADANAIALYDNVTNKGTNGKTIKKAGSPEYVTAQIKTEAAASLAGYLYVYYTPVGA